MGIGSWTLSHTLSIRFCSVQLVGGSAAKGESQQSTQQHKRDTTQSQRTRSSRASMGERRSSPDGEVQIVRNSRLPLLETWDGYSLLHQVLIECLTIRIGSPYAYRKSLTHNLLEWDEASSSGTTKTSATVLAWLVSDGELTQVVTNHVWLDFNLNQQTNDERGRQGSTERSTRIDKANVVHGIWRGNHRNVNKIMGGEPRLNCIGCVIRDLVHRIWSWCRYCPCHVVSVRSQNCCLECVVRTWVKLRPL